MLSLELPMDFFYSFSLIFLVRNLFELFIIMPCFSLVLQVFLIFLGAGFRIVKSDFIAIKVRQLEA